MSDYDNKWISVHEPSGKFVSKFGGNRLLGPKGLTVSQTGELVVVDNKASIAKTMELDKYCDLPGLLYLHPAAIWEGFVQVW